MVVGDLLSRKTTCWRVLVLDKFTYLFDCSVMHSVCYFEHVFGHMPCYL